jgi:hypothetical protein
LVGVVRVAVPDLLRDQLVRAPFYKTSSWDLLRRCRLTGFRWSRRCTRVSLGR